MSLILPPWYFANETDNITAAATATQVTLGASNADGSAVTLLSALAHDVHFLIITMQANASQFGANPCSLLDILQDPAGGTSWASFIDDLLFNGSGPGVSTNNGYTYGFAFPVYIKAGTSLGMQGRTAHSSTRVINVRCWALGNPSRPELWWCGSHVETVGATPAGSRGTNVTPGTSSGFGSWTNIGSTISGAWGAAQVGCGSENSTSMKDQYNFLEMGYGSNKLPGSPRFFVGGNASEQGTLWPHARPWWCDIPVGTQMQARMASSLGSSPDVMQIAIYGVY